MANVKTMAVPLRLNSKIGISAVVLFVYISICAVCLSVVDLNGTSFTSLRGSSSYIAISLLISVVLYGYVELFWKKTKWVEGLSLSVVVPCGLFVLAFIQTYKGGWWFRSYGDGGALSTAINESKPFTRWLIGTTAMIDFYGLLNHFVVSISSQKFVPIASAAIMCASTVAIARHYGSKAFVIFPLTSPIWLAFSLGYDEYYPFVAGLFLLLALWIFSNEDFEVSNFLFVVAGLLPALYVGFVPLTLFVWMKLFSKATSFRSRLFGMSVSVLAYFIAIEIGWPAGHSNYLALLTDDMNLGDFGSHNYQGTSMSDKSPFYSLSSAFSPFHIRDLVFVGVFAGGIATIALVFLVGMNLRLGSVKFKYTPNELKRMVSLPLVFVTWNFLYMFFMIPKLGPKADIDLFFSSNLVFAIWAGILLERIFEIRKLGERAKATILGVMVSLNGPIAATLILYGFKS
jgi:hypothetical protein